MTTMSFTLPDSMKHWIETQVGNDRYSNASDYVCDLIRRDQEHTAKVAAMQRHVDETLASVIHDETMANSILEFTDDDRAAVAASRAPPESKAFNGELD